MGSLRCRLAVRALFGISILVGGHAAHAAEAVTDFHQRIQPILSKYCFDCHADGAHKGNVTLDQFKSDADLLGNHDLWFRVLKNVRSGLMPPKGKERPDTTERAELSQWIKAGAFGIDPANPDPGHSTLRRLNRVEYRNTIRDLLGVDFNTSDEFPPDDTGYGFDTIGDVLSVSPMLLEKYMQAAQQLIGKTVPTVPKVVEHVADIPGSKFKTDTGVALNMSFYEPATATHPLNVSHDGQYRLTLTVHVHGDFVFDPGECNLALKIDDQPAWKEHFTWADTRHFHFDVLPQLSKGKHTLTFDLEPLVPAEKRKLGVVMDISSVAVEGPIEEKFWVSTNNYSKFFPRPAPPADPAERRAYARELLGKFASRAFRRPVDDPTLDRLVKIAESISAQRGKRFEDGIAQAMVATLSSPRFIFRIEGIAPNTADLLDEYALASRLSYFLWSTMPDDELIRLAGRGELRKNLQAQVQRMMADSRADAMIRNFAGQWLELRDVEGININARVIFAQDAAPIQKSTTRPFRRLPKAPIELDDRLRNAMRREPEMLFSEIVHKDESLTTLLSTDHTYLSEPLAALYGIADVKGNEMRRVDLASDSMRGGLLTMGSFLVVTSNPTRTSPVKRGQFILDNILGMPAPPPPPNIPALESAEGNFHDHTPSFREVLEMHRDKPLCRSCHARMDPLGLSLENFNAMGFFREHERGQPIDASGQLITGEKFNDVRELKQILISNHLSDFYRCLTEKMLTYATGRGLEYYDVETVDRIVDRLQQQDGKFSALLTGVIESAPFQRQRTSRDPLKQATATQTEARQLTRDEP